MTYEAWRITFQSSELAARTAYARAEAAEADARRYRWLRDVHDNHYFVTRFIGGAVIPRLSDAALDAAIDAELAKEAK